VIGTARSQAFRSPQGRLNAVHNLVKEGIEALIVCGGDGSLTGADTLRAEWSSHIDELLTQRASPSPAYPQMPKVPETELITPDEAKKHTHFRIAGLVGSIDNDMALTDLTIGASTALHRICESIDNINTTASSHSRAFVVEVMGRHCGWLALLAGVRLGYLVAPLRPLDLTAFSVAPEQILFSSQSGLWKPVHGNKKCVKQLRA